MSRAKWVALLVGGIIVYGLAGWWIASPGYMDADYYTATARELVRGHGLTEPFLWNYLDDPQGLPHPSHLYWMPLTSFVAAAGMVVAGEGFRGAQLPFILLAAGLPTATAALSLRTVGRPRLAWLAGCLALFSGFFLPYFVTTDNFVVFAYTGGIALWLTAESSRRPSPGLWLALGAAVGACHLTRADGLLLLVPALGSAIRLSRGRGLALGSLLVGYVGVMAGWWARNVAVTGFLFSPGVGRTLWLTGYDELFAYPGSLLNPRHLWSTGLGQILETRLWALGENLKTVLAVDGSVFLLPFMVLGAWQVRRHPLVSAAALYFCLLLLAMSVVFPFAGARGGTFHSSAALMPVLWTLAPVGLEAAVAWGARVRRWNLEQAPRVFGGTAVVAAAALSGGLFVPKVIGARPDLPRWDSGRRSYAEAARELQRFEWLAGDPGVVAVNNPPGFYLASGVPAVAIPDGSVETLHQVVERYGVRWVLLDVNRPAGLAGLYANPESAPWLEASASFEDEQGRPVHWLRVLSPGSGE
jgi:hypothetical protein